MIHPPKYLNMRGVYLEALKELTTPFPSVCLEDWPTWNRMVGGFRPREFSILCGPTGSGKTTFLSAQSAQLLKQGVKHFVMSVETGHTDFMKRILSVLASEDLNTGEAVPADKLARLHAQNARFIESDVIEFALYEDRLPVEQLIADLKHMVEVKGCKIAFIDNLNFFMEVTSSRDTIVEMDRVIHALIILCKQLDVHIVMVMHPKKTIEGRIETELDVKGSSTSVQEAQNVFLLNRAHPSRIQDGSCTKFDRELKIAKMRRRGQYAGTTIIFESRGTRYVEKGVV